MFDWLDLVPVVLGSGVAGAVVYQTGRTVRVWIQGRAEVAKVRATADADVLRTWATSAAKIAEMRVAHELSQSGPQLEVVRPPPDQLDPPAS